MDWSPQQNVGVSKGLLWTRQWTLGFQKFLWNPWVAEHRRNPKKDCEFHGVTLLLIALQHLLLWLRICWRFHSHWMYALQSIVIWIIFCLIFYRASKRNIKWQCPYGWLRTIVVIMPSHWGWNGDILLKKLKLGGLSSRSNCTDRSTATWWS
jgi:hypothetical protein